MIRNRVLILALVLTVISSGVMFANANASASTFEVFYDLSNTPKAPIATQSAKVKGNGISALLLSRGSGIGAYELTKGFSANEWVLSDLSLAGAINEEQYFEFGLSVKDGFSASLETLDLSLRRSAKNGAMNFELQVSLDNFATPGITLRSFNYFGRVSGTAPAIDPTVKEQYYYLDHDLAGRPNAIDSPGDPIPTVDLTSIAALQNIPAGTDVTFRLYGWGSPATSPGNTVALGRMNGPRIIGTVKAK